MRIVAVQPRRVDQAHALVRDKRETSPLDETESVKLTFSSLQPEVFKAVYRLQQ